MNIYVKHTEDQYLMVEFTEEDLNNPLLESTIKSILETYNGEQIDNVLHITPSYDQQKENIGQLVDEIRDALIGDIPRYEETEVIVEEAVVDLKGKITKPAVTRTELTPIEKDLSKCPCLSFTTVKAEPLEIKEEPIEPIKEEEAVIDEGIIQEPIPEINRKPL